MPRILLALLLLGVCQEGLAQQSVPPTGSAEPYGKPLAYDKVEGVGPCIAAEVVGDRLYAIGRGVLYVLDICQPQRPKLLGKLSGLGTTRQLVVRNHIAYVTARQDGLWLVDVSDPAKPVLLSHYDSVEMATGIWVSGGLAFLAERCYGVETVDVSDPRRPRHVSTLKTGEAQSCWARDGLLYIGDWAPRKLLVADVRNPRRPVLVGEANLDGYGDGGCLRGNYVFAATGHHARGKTAEAGHGRGHGLEIFDVSKPAEPRFVSRVKFPALYSIFNDMWSAKVSGDHCVVADTHNGLFVVNVRDVRKPIIVAQAQLPKGPIEGQKSNVGRATNGSPVFQGPVETHHDITNLRTNKRDMADAVGGVALADGVIYAAGAYTGLYVVAAPGLAQPVALEPDRPPVLPPLPPTAAEDPDFLVYRPEGQVHAASVQGDIAWLACGVAGIQAVRLGDRLERVFQQPGQADVCYVSVLGNRLFTAESAAGMAVYDIGPDLRLTELGRLTIPGQGVKQVMVPAPGEFGLMHCGGPTAHVVNLKDPRHPKIALSDHQVGLFYGDQLVDKCFDGRYLVAYWQRSGPAWYDVSGPKPVLAGNTPDTTLFSWTDGACALGDQLLVVKRGKYSLLQPNERRQVSDLPAHGVDKVRFAGRPSVVGNTLAVSSRIWGRVWVLDITDIAHPRLKRHYSLPGHPGACAGWQGRLVIPAGYQGLLVEREAAR